MMSTYLPVGDSSTPEWLTAVLRHSGVLQQGRVIAVENVTTAAFNSHLRQLHLQYSADALPSLPARLILKQNIQTAWGMEAGADEVKFYTLIASLKDHPPVIVPCYAAAYDEVTKNSYLLLPDLSETHRAPVTRDQIISLIEGVPSSADIEAVVDTLAQVHAYWWNHAFIGTGTYEMGYWSRNIERFTQYIQRRRTSWEYLIAREQAWFPEEYKLVYERVFAHLPYYWERYLEPRFYSRTNLTLNHGDAYFSNFLCPKAPGTAPTYLLDWQSPDFDIGGNDLANLVATFWTSEQRHEEQREEKILRRYYSVLQQHGVNNYSWDELVTDYQIGIIFWLLMPVQDCFGGSSKEYWWPKMQCLFAAFQDWHCHQLLGF